MWAMEKRCQFRVLHDTRRPAGGAAGPAVEGGKAVAAQGGHGGGRIGRRGGGRKGFGPGARRAGDWRNRTSAGARRLAGCRQPTGTRRNAAEGPDHHSTCQPWPGAAAGPVGAAGSADPGDAAVHAAAGDGRRLGGVADRRRRGAAVRRAGLSLAGPGPPPAADPVGKRAADAAQDRRPCALGEGRGRALPGEARQAGGGGVDRRARHGPAETGACFGRWRRVRRHAVILAGLAAGRLVGRARGIRIMAPQVRVVED